MSVPPLAGKAIALAAVVGPLVTLVGSLLPAALAARVSPLEGIRGPALTREVVFPRRIAVLSGVVWCASVAVLAGCIWGSLAPLLSVPAGVGMMLGFVLLVPPLLRPCGAVFRG